MKEAATSVNLFFGKISEALAKGDRVEIRGLCSFSVKEYNSYQGRNTNGIDPEMLAQTKKKAL